MAKHVNLSMDGLKIGDLITEDGFTFELGEDLENDDLEEDFAYSPHVQFSNEDMLNMLNMNDFDDEDDENNDKETVSLYGMSFSKLKSKMISLTEDEKVMKFVNQKGIGEVIPQNAFVTVHYVGFFEYRDEPFDSTYSCGKPRSLRLGQNLVIPGLEIGIRSMQKHEMALFLIHPDFAFGALGCLPRIPPNEEVVFFVHLLDYMDDGCATIYQNLLPEEKQIFNCVIKPVTHMFVTAKSYFSKYNYKQAIREYRKIIDRLDNVKIKDEIEEKEINELLTRAYRNLGICYNKENMPTRACMALRRVPNPTAKSHYHFGKALLNIGDYNDAMKELQKAYVLEPQNETIRRAIQTTNEKQREYLKIAKRMWKNCFKSKEEQIKVTEFRKAAREMCENLINNSDVIRQPLSEGFTEEEHEIIREEAAILGLNVVTSTRYGKETVYLQKSTS